MFGFQAKILSKGDIPTRSDMVVPFLTRPTHHREREWSKIRRTVPICFQADNGNANIKVGKSDKQAKICQDNAIKAVKHIPST